MKAAGLLQLQSPAMPIIGHPFLPLCGIHLGNSKFITIEQYKENNVTNGPVHIPYYRLSQATKTGFDTLPLPLPPLLHNTNMHHNLKRMGVIIIQPVNEALFNNISSSLQNVGTGYGTEISDSTVVAGQS